MQNKDFVWPALISKSIACSKVCHDSSNHPVECTASANLVPTMQCYTQKTAKLYNCAKRCPGYEDHCDFSATNGKRPDVTACISKIGRVTKTQLAYMPPTRFVVGTMGLREGPRHRTS